LATQAPNAARQIAWPHKHTMQQGSSLGRTSVQCFKVNSLTKQARNAARLIAWPHKH